MWLQKFSAMPKPWAEFQGLTFQLDTAELPHQKIKDCIGLMGKQLKHLLQ